MISILMVLLNVDIVIVGDAWQSSADQSTRFFWKFRLNKISTLEYAETLCRRSNDPSFTRPHSIDSIWNTPYGNNDVSFWKLPPYNSVRLEDYYDRLYDHFNPKYAEKINMTKSLQSDLYWANMKKGNELTWFEAFVTFSHWLAACALYLFLVVLGVYNVWFVLAKKVSDSCAVIEAGLRTLIFLMAIKKVFTVL